MLCYLHVRENQSNGQEDNKMFWPKLSFQYCFKHPLLTQKPKLILRVKYGEAGLEPYISIAFIYQNKNTKMKGLSLMSHHHIALLVLMLESRI
jgi:hypothetical protein